MARRAADSITGLIHEQVSNERRILDLQREISRLFERNRELQRLIERAEALEPGESSAEDA